MKRILILLLIITLIIGYVLFKNKQTINNDKIIQEKTKNTLLNDNRDVYKLLPNNAGFEDVVKFAERDFKLYHVDSMDDVLTMNYSDDMYLYYDPFSKLVINQYGKKAVNYKSLILSQDYEFSNEKNEWIVSKPFISPTKLDDGKIYFVTSDKDSTQTPEMIVYNIYLIKIFENNRSNYSIIFNEKIEGNDMVELEGVVNEWLANNLIKYSKALDNIDLSKNISFYNQNKEILTNLSKSSDFLLLKWVTEKIEEKNKYASINIEYPKFIGINNVEFLNTYIKNIFTEYIAWSRNEVKDFIEGGFCKDSSLECRVDLTSTYDIVSIINDIVNIKLIITDYTMGGLGNHDFLMTINYDLKSNRVLKKSELFCKTDYREKLMPIIRTDIYRTIYTAGNDKFIEEQTRPFHSYDDGVLHDSYDNILLSNFGLLIYFPPYFVGSGSQGIVKLFVPYSNFKDYICLP